MLIPNHPHDERLAALASADADATGDPELASHVASCVRCTETVTELGALRATLAELPDLRPSRPLRLLPEVEPETTAPADRLTGWVRRTFAPVMAIGATLALVGLVGTAAPMTNAVFQDSGSTLEGDAEQPAAAPDAGGAEAAEDGGVAAESGEVQPLATSRSMYGGTDTSQLESSGAGADQREEADDSDALTGLPTERPIWPMLLFSGVALVIVALLLRWIVVPRAG